MHQFSICSGCRAAVDLHGTIRSGKKCPECGEEANWIDDPAQLQERVDHVQSQQSE